MKHHILISLFTNIVFLSFICSSFLMRLLYSACSLSFSRASSCSSTSSVVCTVDSVFLLNCATCLTRCLFSRASPSITSSSSSISWASSIAQGMSDILDLCCATCASSYCLQRSRLYNQLLSWGWTTCLIGLLGPQQPCERSSLIAASLGFSKPLKNILSAFESVQKYIRKLLESLGAFYIYNMYNQADKRKNRLQLIRQNLKTNLALNSHTVALENKLQKRRKRRQSVVLDQNLTQSQKRLLLQEEEISVKAMSKFFEKYHMGEVIGQGSNGLVKKCYLKATDQVYAVKSMKMDQQHILFLKTNFKQIRALDHPNIVKYRTMYLDLRKKICHLVMDYETIPNLHQIKDLTPEEVKHIIQQLIDTVAYIHSKNICHRDIKPQNILYDRLNRQIKLIDFGISKNINNRGNKKDMLTITGTLYYRAPEMFTGGGYDEKVDVWAIGITLYELITGRTPFEAQYLSTTIENIERGEIKFEGEVWENYGKSPKDLIIRLLKKRQDRFTANQAKKHFWFNKRPSLPIDLSKSDSLSLKMGDFISLNSQKYAQDLEHSMTTTKIPHIEVQIKRKNTLNESDYSDSLIEIQSEGDKQVDSPLYDDRNAIPKLQEEPFRLALCKEDSVQST